MTRYLPGPLWMLTDAKKRPVIGGLRGRSPISALIRRHPLPSFFVLAYALSWWAVPFGAFLPFGPLLAALVVTAVVDGRPGLRALKRRLLHWRVGWRWYAVALGLPATIVFGAIALNIGLGAPASALDSLDPWYLLVLAFVVRLINPLDGPMGEEPGWRGFALLRLQAGRSPLHASVILGLLIAGWHLPLVFLPREHLAPVLLPATVAITFVYTWVFNHTGGSVFMTLVTHAAEGAIRLGAVGFVAADATRIAYLYAAGWCTVAIAIVIFDRQFRRAPAHVSRDRTPTAWQATPEQKVAVVPATLDQAVADHAL